MEKVPFLRPSIKEKDIEKMNEVLRSGWLCPGEHTRKFEENLSNYLNTKHAVMTDSCRSALHLSLIIAGVDSGDEVITTPLSYVATSNAILYQDAKPVFVDVESETGLIDIDRIEDKITEKTKAIIPVHLYGQMIDMKRLRKLADEYDLVIIEDAAHAIESERGGVKPGQLSFSACFSFHVAKNITCGEGGALVSNNSEVAERAELLRRDGVINTEEGKRRMVDFGYKYRSTDFQAAFLNNQFKRIKKLHKSRQKVIQRYRQGFSGLEGVSFPKKVGDSTHSGHMFVIWVDPYFRDKIREELHNEGVETSIHYEPIHLEPYYKDRFGYQKGDFPIAEELGRKTITLPTYPSLTGKEQGYIIDRVKTIVNKL